MRILIVEDDASSRELLSRFLSVYGRCETAGDGEAAVQAFRAALQEKDPYDLVCLDIQMPKMDGYEALQHIRDLEKAHGIKSNARAKVIMTTAEDKKPAITEAFLKGASWYLIKPVTREKLVSRLRNLGVIPAE